MARLTLLSGLADAVRLAASRGMLLSLTYNTLAVGLALTGSIGPLGAAVLMPLSSLSMVGSIAASFYWSKKRWVS